MNSFPIIAFKTYEINEGYPTKISCIESWGKYLVVGTEKGQVVVYEVAANTQPPMRTNNLASSVEDSKKAFVLKLKNNQKELSKKAIAQLGVMEPENIVLVLSDGVVNAYSLPFLTKRDTPSLSKINLKQQCYLFSIDKSDSVWRMVLALKKKLIVTEWNGGDFFFKKEFTVPDIVKTCVWCGQSLCIGMKREYNLIEPNGAITDIFNSGRSNPLAISIPNQQVLLARDNISVFIGYDGKPTRKYGLSWSDTPIASAISFPYVISVLPKTVEVQSMFATLGQNITITGANFITVTSEGDAYIASKNKGGPIYRLSPVPFTEQIDFLVKRKRFSDALLICENVDKSTISDKEERLKYLKLLNGYSYFGSSHYNQAMEIFLELDVDPLKVIALYPNLLPQKIRGNFSFEIIIEEPKGQTTLVKGLESLANFLESKRKELNLSEKKASESMDSFDQVEWADTTSVATIIDTTLVRCYLLCINYIQLNTLLSMNNYCHVKECVNLLNQHQKYKELVLLYKSRGLHRNALELLQKMASDPRSGGEKDLLGVKSSIEYMKALGKDHFDLIIMYSKWVIRKNPREGLEIFTFPRKLQQQLPAAKVLSHLEELTKSGVDSGITIETLVIPYLEFLINDLQETSIDFHNNLVKCYFEVVINLKKAETQRDPNTSKFTPGTEPGHLGTMRRKLLFFLESSKHYKPAHMISQFKFAEEGLHEEKAILLSKIGKHGEALKEYVHKLNDFNVAEDYCKKYYDPENEESRDVYLSLLEVYLTPPQNDFPNVDELHNAAYKLLNKHYKEIDPVKALEKILPESTPISNLYPYLEKVIRDLNKAKRNNQIITSLQKCETMKTKAERLNLRSRVVKITEETVCAVCNKRLGEAAFALYPTTTSDNTPVTVHYLCYKNQKDKNVCPVTGQKFGEDNTVPTNH